MKKYLLFCLVVWGLFIGLGNSTAYAQSDDETEVFELVNRERIKYKLPPLVWDDEIASVARNYSRKMAREGFFDHYDRSGKSVADRAKNAEWDSIGENLFMGSERSDLLSFSVRGWMRSTPHRKNIITRNYTGTGIGIAKARNGYVYITQVFIEQPSARASRRR